MDSLAVVWIQRNRNIFFKVYFILNLVKVYNVNFYNYSLSITAENFHGAERKEIQLNMKTRSPRISPV